MQNEDREISRIPCPVCGKLTVDATLIEYGEVCTDVWYFCRCGVVFNNSTPEPYKHEFNDKLYLHYIHSMNVYGSLIEDMIYGRKFLKNINRNVNEYMESRGWVIVEDKPSFILSQEELEYCKDPKAYLKRCYDLLEDEGTLFIDTPDTMAIKDIGKSFFTHWDAKHIKILWDKESLITELKKIGFDIVLVRRNYTSRYSKGNTVHIMAQKTKY